MDTHQFSGIITGCGESISGREDSQLYWRVSYDWAGRNQQGLCAQRGGRNRKMAGTNCDLPAQTPLHLGMQLRMLCFQISVHCGQSQFFLLLYYHPGHRCQWWQTKSSSYSSLKCFVSCLSPSATQSRSCSLRYTFHSFNSEALVLRHDLSGHSFSHFAGLDGSMQLSEVWICALSGHTGAGWKDRGLWGHTDPGLNPCFATYWLWENHWNSMNLISSSEKCPHLYNGRQPLYRIL